MQLKTVTIEKPDDTNVILGQTHFIKSVEVIHEALAGAVPGIKFGLASLRQGFASEVTQWEQTFAGGQRA